MCPPLRVHTSVNRQVCEEIGDDVVVLLTQEVREWEVWRRRAGGGDGGGGKVGVCTHSLSVLPKSAVRYVQEMGDDVVLLTWERREWVGVGLGGSDL